MIPPHTPQILACGPETQRGSPSDCNSGSRSFDWLLLQVTLHAVGHVILFKSTSSGQLTVSVRDSSRRIQLDGDAVWLLDFVLDSHLLQPREAAVFIIVVSTILSFITCLTVLILLQLTTPSIKNN